MIKYLKQENDFNEIIKERVLVDFYADWCGPCKRLMEVLEDIDSIDILKVNTDMFPSLARKYGIMSIPTLILFENEEELRKEIGFRTKDEIEEMLK